MNHSATYSPEDNKIRIYPAFRLPREDYDKLKNAGFSWAPKQEIFVAPMWTPGRYDLALEMCGEVGDEDKSLVERAEERAERFEDYSEKRADDANRARESVAAIADNIPLGQPILIGHHSERHARRDAEKIENGMRKAVKMWETAKYWEQRAAGALHHAKYKELPEVRARRIKTIEADKRKREKSISEATARIKQWEAVKNADSFDMAVKVAGFDGVSSTFPISHYPRKEGASTYEGMQSLWGALTGGIIDAQKAAEIALRVHARTIERGSRWLEHFNNRLAYERAMLGEQLGTPNGDFSDKWAHIVPGGRVLVRGEWVTVLRVNRKGGKVCSVSTNARYVSVRQVEEIKDYKEPDSKTAELAKEANKLPPICNYPGEGFTHITKQEWAEKHADYKGTREMGAGASRAGGYRPDVQNSSESVGRHRVRTMVKSGSLVPVYITDQKRTDPPKIEESMSERPQLEAPEIAVTKSRPATEQKPCEFEALKDALKNGVQVVTANQLFPTPPELVARMIEAADLKPGLRILEPSAGTGAILDKLPNDCTAVAVEINPTLGGRLDASRGPVVIGDFLQCNKTTLWGEFDRVLMNPPFENAADIKHILNALEMLKDGGKLVAICANGPRQRERLMPLVTEWNDLPSGTFSSSGTQVNTALIVFDK